MDMKLTEFKLLTSTIWNEKNIPVTIDMTEDKCEARYIGLDSILIPASSPF